METPWLKRRRPALSSWSSGVEAANAAGTNNDKVVNAKREQDVWAAKFKGLFS